MESALPPDLLACAYRSRSGEFAWRRTDAIRAVRALEAAGLAVLGGETWAIVPGTHSILGAIPQEQGLPAVMSWSISREPQEPWTTFCRRAADFAVSVLTDPTLERGVASVYRPHLWYCLTEATEAEHDQLVSG